MTRPPRLKAAGRRAFRKTCQRAHGLEGQAAIAELLFRFAASFDDKDWDAMRRCLAESVNCDYLILVLRHGAWRASLIVQTITWNRGNPDLHRGLRDAGR